MFSKTRLIHNIVEFLDFLLCDLRRYISSFSHTLS